LTEQYIRESKVFAASIIAEETPIKMIGKFGFRTGRDFNKFDDVNYKIGKVGSPMVLDNTVGFLEVEVSSEIDLGKYTLFIGEVVACETIDKEKIPMTYSYYRDVKGGRTPRTAATYLNKEAAAKTEESQE